MDGLAGLEINNMVDISKFSCILWKEGVNVYIGIIMANSTSDNIKSLVWGSINFDFRTI